MMLEQAHTILEQYKSMGETIPPQLEDLLQTVAGMHYEYSVQFLEGDTWMYEDYLRVDESENWAEFLTDDPDKACWTGFMECGAEVASYASEPDSKKTRIVRRLVSNVEVVE